MDGKKIKVLRILNRFNLGGPTYNATFLSAFLGSEFETILIGGVPDEGETDSLHIVRQYGLEPIVINEMQRNPNVKSDFLAYKKIKRIIEIEKPDIVHTHAFKAGLLGRRAAAKMKVPIIVHTYHGHVFHSYFNNWKTSVIKGLERALAKRSTAIVTISEIQKKEIVTDHRITSSEKAHVIPLGFDLEKFRTDKEARRKITRKEFNLEEDEVAIAIIGRLAPIKDHDFFLDVIEKMALDPQTKFKVFIVGDGSERERIASRVKEINDQFGEIIFLTSWILDIASFNQGMDIVCLTSKNEGTPVSLIEAQAGGLPVVTTDVGGIRDVVQDGVTGFVTARGDIETYAQKLRLLVNEDKMRKDFGKKGEAFIFGKFHYSRLIDDMRALYLKLWNENK
ncbi:MAG: glycosyltransferase [Crocinitomicaceae bacterium]|nr:glycosyltransferase [Crocinitomicaceae bacterium]